MTKQEFILEILGNFLPDESDFAGPSTLTEIAKGTSEVVHLGGGASFEIPNDILFTLVQLSSTIYFVLEIRKHFKDRGKQPTHQELTEEYNERQSNLKNSTPSFPKSFTEEQKEEIFRYIVERLKTENIDDAK